MSTLMESLKSTSPSAYRNMLRLYQNKKIPTTFACKGFKQANLVIISQKYAQDFFVFAKGNQGAIPLLYKSQPGEYQAPPLCKASDVRTDVPAYCKIVKGNIECQLEDLLEFDWSDYVTFYIGCSFSFNDILLSHKIVEEDKQPANVSMFVTSLDCYKSGPFNCKMVVSMRAIPKSKLSLTASVCDSLHDVHGAPIHYGNPKAIGIDTISKPDFGEVTKLKLDEIPVFWCCGVTGLEALKSANLDLAFSHSPGCMFITDVVQDNTASKIGSNDMPLISAVIEYNSKASCYSSLSQITLTMLNDIYFIVQQDLGGRGIKNLVIPEDFVKSALALSHASSVAMVTGFPVHEGDPPDETDGLTGIVSLAAVLQSLRKQVVLYVDDYATQLNEKIIQRLVEEKILKERIAVIPYEAGKTSLRDKNGLAMYDVVLSSERIGRAKDGGYYTMKGRNLVSRVSPFDEFFMDATASGEITTISIGDGGNELGMGKVFGKVQDSIPRGDKVGCVVASDLLIAAGVSNWGCYGLGVALYALRSCPIHDRYIRRAIGFPINASEQMRNYLPTVARERRTLEIVEEFGIKDGVRPDQKLSVDGMRFDVEHTKILMDMLNIIFHSNESNAMKH